MCASFTIALKVGVYSLKLEGLEFGRNSVLGPEGRIQIKCCVPIAHFSKNVNSRVQSFEPNFLAYPRCDLKYLKYIR